jgi:hypothetical protein
VPEQGENHEEEVMSRIVREHGAGRVALRWALIALLVVPGVAFAQTGAPEGEEQALPEASLLLEKFIEATGGRAAYDKLRNRVSKGTLSMPIQGIEGHLSVYEAAPNKAYAVVSLGEAGTILSGSTGEVVWEIAPGQPPQIKSGEDLQAALAEATFNSVTRWEEFYEKGECVGAETGDDGIVYKVEMTPKAGEMQVWYFDRYSHLITRVEKKVKTPNGLLPVTVVMEDYKSVDGILLPHKLTEKIMGMSVETVLTKVSHNEEIAEDRFDPPTAVQKLLDPPAAEEDTAAPEAEEE